MTGTTPKIETARPDVLIQNDAWADVQHAVAKLNRLAGTYRNERDEAREAAAKSRANAEEWGNRLIAKTAEAARLRGLVLAYMDACPSAGTLYDEARAVLNEGKTKTAVCDAIGAYNDARAGKVKP